MAEWLTTARPSGSERHFYDYDDRKVDCLTLTKASLNKMLHGNYLSLEEFN